MRRTRSKYLQTLVANEFVYDSTLDVMESIGWTQRWFDKLLHFSRTWKAMGKPTRVTGKLLHEHTGSVHGTSKWKLLFDWGGILREDSRAELTREGERLLNKLLTPSGRKYAKALDFGRFTAMRIREDIVAKRVNGRVVRSVTGMPTYFVLASELEDEIPEPVFVRPVHKSLREDLCAAKPDRLLELLEPHDCSFLKETVCLYRREKFVPYGIAINVKNYIDAHTVIQRTQG